MKKLLLILMTISFTAFAAPCSDKKVTTTKQSKPTPEGVKLMKNISNDQIKWDGTFISLTPTNPHPDLIRIAKMGKKMNPHLLKSLNDPKKFATAHYLLVIINPIKQKSSATHWNRLKITLHANGKTEFHPEQRAELIKFWRKRVQKQKK